MSSLSMTLEELEDNFAFLDDWEDKYRTIIELGRSLPPLDASEMNEMTRVRGCQSQVWLVEDRDGVGRLFFRGDSDAYIVKGLVAIIMLIFSGKKPNEVLSTDARSILDGLGLASHLSPQRANGLFAMVERIQKMAKKVGSELNTAV